MQQEIRCPNCGGQIESGQQFCVWCGARLCPHCHEAVPQTVTSCPRCGYLLRPGQPGGVAQPSPPAASPWAPSPGPGAPIPQPPSVASPQTSSPGQGVPTPQPRDGPKYVMGHQFAGTSGHPSAVEYGKTHIKSSLEQEPWATSLPARRFPKAMVAIVVISGIGLLGFAAIAFGLFGDTFSTAQEFISGVEWPSFLSHTPADVTPPEIQSVLVSDITQTSAVVTWETDEPATSQLMMCEPDGFCTWTEPEETLITNHSVALSDLKPDTTYHYTVISMDAEENEATSEGELATLGQGDTTPPVISGVDVSGRGESSATISWETDEAATGRVEYGTTDAYGLTTPSDEELTTSHNITLTGLEPDITYYFRVKSEDASGNEAISETARTFATLSTSSVGHEVGNRAPDFTLQTIDGESVTLSDLRGKMVMVNFRTIGSDPRGNELYAIQAVFSKVSHEELAILVIHIKESAKDVESFVAGKDLTFPILIDPQGEVAAQYSVTSIPTTFFIDADGIIRKVEDERLRNAQQIETILGSL